jgi:hypothetical protein
MFVLEHENGLARPPRRSNPPTSYSRIAKITPEAPVLTKPFEIGDLAAAETRLGDTHEDFGRADIGKAKGEQRGRSSATALSENEMIPNPPRSTLLRQVVAYCYLFR